MNLRTLMLDLVPPELKLTREERTELSLRIGDIPRTPQEKRRHRWIGLPATLCLAIASIFIPMACMVIAGRVGLFPAAIVFVLAAMAWWWCFALIAAFENRRRVWAALHDLGYEVCGNCGYWLRNLTESVTRCPECGKERTPMQNPSSP